MCVYDCVCVCVYVCVSVCVRVRVRVRERERERVSAHFLLYLLSNLGTTDDSSPVDISNLVFYIYHNGESEG